MRPLIAILAGIVLTTLGLTTNPALAQEDAGAGALEEVIVSARKRDELLKDIPMAVSVFSGDFLETNLVENVTDLFGTAPSVHFVAAEFGSDTIGQHLVIRGIGATPIIEPAVGTFVDGVYQPDMGFDMDFMELERVEILRGPQGTLFGRNTQGGALNIVTRKPGEEFEAKVRLGYDEFNTLDVQTYLSAPLGERTAASIALRYKEGDGFLDNLVLGVPQTAFEQMMARFRLVSQLSDSVDIDMSIDTSQWTGGMLGAGVPDSGVDDYITFNSDLEDSKNDIYGGYFRLNWALLGATFSSITGYRGADVLQMTDTDGREPKGNIQYINVEQSAFTQELRLVSDNGDSPWEWTVGAFYFDESRYMSQVIEAGEVLPEFGILAGLTADQWYDIDRTGWALFGQATYTMGDWDFTVGTRYSKEKPEIYSHVNFTVPFFELIGLPPTTDFFDGNKTTIDAFTPMGSIKWSFSDNASVYFTVAQGFKAGGFQDFQGAPGPEYEPFDNEDSTSYELGYKGSLLDGRMSLNLAAHHTDIKNQQIRVRVFTPFPINRVFNIGESYTQGVEGELSALLTDNLLLSLSYSYTKSKFDKIDVPPEADPSDNINFLEGLPFPFVPEHTGSASLKYTHPLDNGMSFSVLGSVRYVGSYVTGLNTVADPLGNVAVFLPEVPDYTIGTVRLSLDTDKWSASLYVDNLFDENIVLVQQLGSFYTNEPFNVLAAPRTIGGRFEYRF